MVASATQNWTHEANQKLDSQQVKSTHRGAAFLVIATVSGALFLFVGIVIIGVLWYGSFLGTRSALDTLQLAFRKAEEKTLSGQIAGIIRPTWSIPQQFVYRLRGGLGQIAKGQGDSVIFPPQHEDFRDPVRFERLVQELFPLLNREAHMRSASPDRSNFTHGNVIAVLVMLALDANSQPTGDAATCKNTVSGVVIFDVETLNTYTAAAVFADNTSSTGFYRATYEVDHVNNLLGPFVGGRPHGSDNCLRNMAPLWSGNQLEDWFNFTYSGPRNPGIGWGNHFTGSVPIYDEAQAQVGRISVPISLGRSIGPILKGIVEDSEVLRGGEAALFTASGLVLGLSEAGASPRADPEDPSEVQAERLEELMPGSKTERALAALHRQFGTFCPESQEVLTGEDFLVDVTPFVATEHGMPPLPERWCQMVTLPRENIFQSIDEAVDAAVVAGVACIISSCGAVAILGVALVVAVRTQRRMRKEAYDFDLNVVRDAAQSMTKLTAPLVLVSAEDFLARSELECYEEWRDAGCVKVLDSLEAVEVFKAMGNLIAFFSHQWLGWTLPDNAESVQFRSMRRSVEQLVAGQPGKTIYVWVDYACIAQRHAESQAMAVAALPVFVSLVDHFVICAPSARHRDTGLPVGLDSYARRGWCRAEMLAKACSGGIEKMFICEGDEAEMRSFTHEDMKKISLSVYEGDFTEKMDAEKLVVPILGLYSLILQGKEASLEPIREFIEGRKSTFFPHSYEVEVDGVLETRKLFGDLVSLMEEYIAEGKESSKKNFTSANSV